MFPSPKRMFLTKGVGVHRHALTAFEFALRDADIEQQNLVYVSSWRDRRPMNSGVVSTPALVWPDRPIPTCMGIFRSCTDTA